MQQTWTLREDISRLEAFEMWIWRKISWRDHETNMQVLLTVGEQQSLMNAIRVRQRNWIGHILRGNSLLRTALEGKVEGKRTREAKDQDARPDHDRRTHQTQLR